MSSENALTLQNVGKCYNIFHKPADRLKQMLVLGQKKYYSEYWAVRDANLTVARGERLAIVGRNGAGKSTLLQLVCGTLAPTEGRIAVKGRVAALLELGAGFNPEFTGVENIYLSASILGLRKEALRQRYQSIVDFADIGEFLDQPVKTYSTGMYARLAFAIAIHVDPDVLVVDEALSVGDEAFQRKCYARVQKLCERGVTLLFVSHSTNAVIELCDRAVLMDKGEILQTGSPKAVVAAYQRLAFAAPAQQGEIRRQIRTGSAHAESPRRNAEHYVHALQDDERFDPSLRPVATVEYQQCGCTISQPHLTTTRGAAVNILAAGREYHYRYRVTFDRPARAVRFGMMIKTTTGVELAGLLSHAEGQGIEVLGHESFEVTFRFVANLNPGNYFLNAGVTGDLGGGDRYLHRILDALMFRIPTHRSLVASGYVNLAGAPGPAASWVVAGVQERAPAPGTDPVQTAHHG